MLQPLRNAYVETPRGQLHVQTLGAGEPVLLLQILPFSTVFLEGLMRQLAAAGYAAHAIDLMGYGRSSPRQSAWQVEDHADNLIAALDALKLTPVGTVCGHFTAMVAVQAALQAPGRLGRLVLDGVPLWSREIATERLRTPTVRADWTADGAALQGQWASAIALLRRFDPELSLAAEHQARLFEAVSHFIAIGLGPDATSAIMQYDLEAALPNLTDPVLVIGSPTDSLRDRHDRALALIPGAVGHLFTDLHPLYRLHAPERAGRYMRVVDAFFRPSPDLPSLEPES